jgi:hypothetical protein
MFREYFFQNKLALPLKKNYDSKSLQHLNLEIISYIK